MGCSASSQARTVETQARPAPAPQTVSNQGEANDLQIANVDRVKPGHVESPKEENIQGERSQTQEPKPGIYCSLLVS